MATFTNKDIIDEMIENGGSYQGDPAPVAIYETYNNMSKKTEWVVCYSTSDVHAMSHSPVIESAVRIWPK